MPSRRSGAPRLQGRVKPFANGWFMFVAPSSGRILSVSQMIEPENNQVVKDGLVKILPMYKNVDCLIYDRACSYIVRAKSEPELQQLKYITCDNWHGFNHMSSCPCRPQGVRRLKKRLTGVNTAVREQVVPWFRSYAKTRNEMRPLRNRCMVLVFCQEHNRTLAGGEAVTHLGPSSARGTKHKGQYECSSHVYKRPALRE